MNQSSSYNSEYILSAQGICKTFEDGKKYVEVLKGVDINVKPAEMVAIVGTSGSGKSTLLHILGGLDSPDKGLVMVAGQDIHQLSIKAQGDLRNRHLGFVYQFHHLLAEFTALENVSIPLIIAGLSEQKARHRAQQIIAKVGLADRTSHKPSELSGGERQRIAIARAMVTKPSCILADEPTGNLDRKTAESINQLMFELNRDEETSFLIVSHDIQLAQKMQKRYDLDSGILVLAE
ncbi:MAG: lipoprotein-releasing ABC transporter ATP-binding protein LolD [Enterobacterales bacterium]|nr:lipoprotein-releasing ABC transporter ATP-binding protein LolD [Enterobacterales bacterium]